MVLKKAVAGFLVVCLLVWPWYGVVEATVASGAFTDRGVFQLTASGAAKIGLAESQVAAAVRVLGMLGRVSSVVTVGFVAYEVTSGLWDWWNATYDAGTAYPTATPGMAGTFGVQSGADIGDCLKYQWSTAPGGSPTTFYDLTDVTNCPPGIWSAVVGQTGNLWVDANGWTWRAVYLHGLNAQLPSSSVGHAVPNSSTERAAFVGAVDGAKSDLTAMSQADLDWAAATSGASTAYAGSSLDALTGMLDAARAVVSGGVALGGSDVVVASAASSTGTMPGAIPGTVEITGVGSDSAAVVAAVQDTNRKLDEIKEKLDTPASPASAEVCPECSREDKWAALWDTIKTAAASAPVFGLLARLAWPGVGTVQRQWTLGSWQGHQMSIDLDNSGIGTVITVVRFVVIGGAVIVAYMIIFA